MLKWTIYVSGRYFFVKRIHKGPYSKAFQIESPTAVNEIIYAETPDFQLRPKIDFHPYREQGKEYFTAVGRFFLFWPQKYRILDASNDVIGFIKEKFSFTGGNYAIEDSRGNKIAILKNYAFRNFWSGLSIYRMDVKSLLRRKVNYSLDLLKGSTIVGTISIEQGDSLLDKTFKATVDLSQDSQKSIDRRTALALAVLLEPITWSWSANTGGV